MNIGEVIREYRKKNDLTQEKMAKRLGVSAPAVNKWENGNSYPDIMLLAPIARLFGISIDTLLSFQGDLTEQKTGQILDELENKLRIESYEDAFLWGKKICEQYPNCYSLIWQLVTMLDGWRNKREVTDVEEYETFISECYERCLESADENMRSRAADSLFCFYLNKGQYEKAEGYLEYFSDQNPEKKRKQAVIYSKTGRTQEAYKAYEELLLSGYQSANMVLHGMYQMALLEEDKAKAVELVEKQTELARVFEVGTYYETSCGLDLAREEKDVEKTIEIMENMVRSVSDMCKFASSKLYSHIDFRGTKEGFIAEVTEKMIECFKDQAAYGYMSDNRRWQQLVSRKM